MRFGILNHNRAWKLTAVTGKTKVFVKMKFPNVMDILNQGASVCQALLAIMKLVIVFHRIHVPLVHGVLKPNDIPNV